MMFKLFSRTADTQSLCQSRLFNNETFYKTFNKDLYYAQRRVYIESPFITTKRVNELLPIIGKLREKNLAVTINTRHPNEHDGRYIDEALRGIQGLQEMGVTILYTVKHHRKLAVIDDVLWEGSLNILSQNDSCEIMRRIVSSTLAEEMLSFTGVNKYVA